MKRFCGLVFFILSAAAAIAAPTWIKQPYTVAEFVPAQHNLVLGKLPASGSSGCSSTVESTGGPSKFTDGVAGSSNISRGLIEDNAVLVYDLLAFGADVYAINLYSCWNDTGRDRITISSIECQVAGGGESWYAIENSMVSYESSSYHNRASLSNASGAPLAEAATAIRICFGTQENGHVGYGEIEVVGVESIIESDSIVLYGTPGYSGKYDGRIHSLDVAVRWPRSGAQVLYSESPEGPFVDVVPTICMAGAKTVYYTVSAEGYPTITNSALMSVAKAPLTVTARDAWIVVGGVATNNGVNYSGFVDGEGVESLAGTLTFSYGNYAPGQSGVFPIVPSGLTSPNYDIAYGWGKLQASYPSGSETIDGIQYWYEGNLTGVSIRGIGDRVLIAPPSTYGYSLPLGVAALDVPSRLGDAPVTEFSPVFVDARWNTVLSIAIPDTVTSVDLFWGLEETGIYLNATNGLVYVDGWLCGYKGEPPSGDVVLPSWCRGVASYALSDSPNLVSIAIPDAIPNLGSEMLSGCSGLKQVTLSGARSSLNADAFRSGWLSSEELKTFKPEFSLPSSITNLVLNGLSFPCSISNNIVVLQISEGPIEMNWSSSTDFSSIFLPLRVVIPSSVKTIGYSAFSSCYGLRAVDIPGSVTTIGDYAFSDCVNLPSITIPESVSSIGENAFRECSGLSSALFLGDAPGSPSSWFDDCQSLGAIYVLEDATGWEDAVSVGWWEDPASGEYGEHFVPVIRISSIQDFELRRFAAATGCPFEVFSGLTNNPALSIDADAGTATLSGAAVGDGGTGGFSLTTVGRGELSFDWRVSSENGADFAWWTNGLASAKISGKSGGWLSVTNRVSTEGQTNVWAFGYTKDVSDADGDDAAYFRNLQWRSFHAVSVSGGTGGGEYLNGDEVILEAEDRGRAYRFLQWYQSSGGAVSFNGALAKTSFTMPKWSVGFTAQYQALAGNSVAVNGGAGSGFFYEDEKISIAAAEKPGYTFLRWEGDTDILADASLPSCSFTMPTFPVTLYAVYAAPASQRRLSVEHGAGGGMHPVGDTVWVTAEDPGPGLVFSRWTGDAVALLASALAPRTSLAMPGTNASLCATYARIPANETGEIATNHFVSVTNGSGSGYYPPTRQVAIRADDAPLHSWFTGWSDPSGVLTNAFLAANSFAMPAVDVLLEACYANEAEGSDIATVIQRAFGLPDCAMPLTGVAGAVSLADGCLTVAGSVLGDGAHAAFSVKTSGNGQLVFRWNVSSTLDTDLAAYALDGIEQARFSGKANPWVWVTNTITDGGDHVWTFSYTKDASGQSGSDALWVSDIAWRGALPPAAVVDGVALDTSYLTVNGFLAPSDYTTGEELASLWRSPGANGKSLMENFIAGLDPADPDSVFEVDIGLTNGVPFVSWRPDLGSASRRYTIFGKGMLDDAYWTSPTNGNSRFFQVSVGMPSDDVARPAIAACDSLENGIALVWDNIPGAANYLVLRSRTGSIEDAETIAATRNSGYLDEEAVAFTGENLAYWVLACDGTNRAFSSSVQFVRISTISAPTGVSASDGEFTDKVRVCWDAVSGATGYSVYRSSTPASSNAIRLASSPFPAGLGSILDDIHYDDYSADADAAYYYFVKASNAKDESAFSAGNLGSRDPSGTSLGDAVMVSFLPNGADFVPVAIEYIIASPYNYLPSAARDGYSFDGWSTDPETGSPVVEETPASGFVSSLFAKWTLVAYSVTYNGNGSTSGATADSSHTYGVSKTLTANGFTRTGYMFAGWATSAGGAVAFSNGQSVMNLTATQGAVVTLYAKWTPITYTVVYNGNGSTGGSTANSSHTYDVSKTLTANGFIRTGLTFAGWATSADGGVAYGDGQSALNLADTQGAVVTLYARWAPPGMVPIPGGTNSGADPDFGAYSLTVSPLFMDATEVTKAKWDEVYTWAITNGYSFDNAGSGKAADHPVQTVNWYDVVKWCNARSEKEGRPAVYTVSGAVYKTGQKNSVVQTSAAGYRLPTEVEWEYAARGGLSGKRFPWGDTIQHERANYYSRYSSYDTSPTRGYHPDYDNEPKPYTSRVGSFPPNGYGLYDMAGNVAEWCNDWVLGGAAAYRGGSWSSDGGGVARCRYSSYRFRPGGYDNHGFRAVCR